MAQWHESALECISIRYMGLALHSVLPLRLRYPQMHLSLSLFHCDTPDGNRAKEEQFQWFVVSKGTANDLELLSEPQLERLLTSARENPYDNRPFAALAKLLETSLGIEAYEFFVDNILGLPSAIACFFEDYAQPDEISVDFQGTKTLNYPKYRVYKFAFACPAFPVCRAVQNCVNLRPQRGKI
jgi:hypothetical protein